MQRIAISQQRKYDLLNAIKAAILVLAGENTMEQQVRFFGKYLPKAPKTGKPEATYEFSYDNCFDVVFEKDEKLAWNTAKVYIASDKLTRFNKRYFAELLQLNFNKFSQHTDTVSYDTHHYTWQLNDQINVMFKVNIEALEEDINYPKDFYQVIVSRVV